MDLLERFIAWLLSLFQGVGGGGLPTPSGEMPEGESAPVGGGNRHAVTEPENISARFHDSGSPAWRNQWPGTPMAGKHGGTDFRAPHGSTVYAPYSMRIIAIGYYPDEGRKGYYVIGTLSDGAEYYSGHLNNVTVKRGDSIGAGTPLGVTWDWWGERGRAHTHVQVKVRGAIVDPERYFASH